MNMNRKNPAISTPRTRAVHRITVIPGDDESPLADGGVETWPDVEFIGGGVLRSLEESWLALSDREHTRSSRQGVNR
jgi:hypothetical protein